ncbi:ileal sodium/bile acid cotransporter-like [Panulirus ornatus]|uniref:ileal sodium/bile acid cotransporter-like n=1 Tax=Panulirus ornatus TaxID=150431 RepID=UPI003A8B251A
MAGQFLLLPATGFALCLIFQFRPYVSLGILVVSCCPGGTFSNFFTFWADGDLALSIMMTTCSSLLAFGGMPFNLWLYSHYWLTDDEDSIVIPYRSIIISMAFVTFPVVVGMVVKHYHERTASILTKVASIVGWLGAVIASVVAFILFWEAIKMVTPLVVLASLLLPFLGFIFAYCLAKVSCQSHRMARTIGIETGSQNMAVAATIIILSFSDPVVTAQVILFPSMYALTILLEAFLGIGLFTLYKRKFSKDDDDYPVVHTAKIKQSACEEGELENF